MNLNTESFVKAVGISEATSEDNAGGGGAAVGTVVNSVMYLITLASIPRRALRRVCIAETLST